MKNIFYILLLTSTFTFAQDLQIQYFETDQREESIKTIWVMDENGTEKIKDFKAKSTIDLINQYKDKGYKVNSIHHTLNQEYSIMKYIIYFDKKEE